MATLNKCLHDIIIASTKKFNIIQVTEAIDGEDRTPFLQFDSDENTLEIGITKIIYLKLFKESHTLWHEYYIPQLKRNQNFLQDCSLPELWKLYYMTVGYLISTNEHHSVVRLHEVIVMKLYQQLGSAFLTNEFKIITSFATSRIQRINKSSSLWFLIKKLSILLIFDPLISNTNTDIAVQNYFEVIDSCLLSCRIHFANYYASYFLISCLRLNTIIMTTTDQIEDKKRIVAINTYILGHLKHLSQEKLTDISLWGALKVYFTEQIHLHNRSFIKGSSQHCYIIDDYNRCKSSLEEQSKSALCTLSTEEIAVERDEPESNIIQQLDQLIHWLLKVKCSVYSPYKLILSVYWILKVDLSSYASLKGAVILEKENEDSKLKLIKNKNDSLYEKNRQYLIILESVISTFFK